MTDFAENVNELTKIEHSSFFVNFKYKLRMKFNIMKIFNLQST